jgi:hypothetical protein
MQESSGVDFRDPDAYRPDATGRVSEAPTDSSGGASVQGRSAQGDFALEWRRSYGPSWRLDLIVLGLLVFLIGAMQPLSDADLPLHLATGEWIVRHGTVPFTEPFAWTRLGSSYFAYSWALEVPYYLIMRWSGPAGLHALQGLILLAVAGSVLVLAKAARWKPWVALCMAALNVAAAMLVVPALRPQLVLFALIPLAWAFVYSILTAPRIRWATIGLILTSTAAANSHLFFVLTAAPLALVVANPPRDRRRMWATCGAIVLGWFISPYGLSWPDVFRLNFSYNALLVKPSPILEFRPGFRASTALFLALPLTWAPWVVSRTRLHLRERVVHGALWLAGLVAFAYAGRLLLCWWLITLPLSAAGLTVLWSGGQVAAPRRFVRITTYALVGLISIVLVTAMPAQWRNEGDAVSRRLPSEAGISIDPLLVWLQCNTRSDASGRIFTWFDYGSYLVWRLPAYSASIDGRTIFPDSVARAEMLVSGLLPRRDYHVWSSADIAIVPLWFGIAPTLDSAQGWARAASLRRLDSPRDSVGLWVQRSWWDRFSTSTLVKGGATVTGAAAEASIADCSNTPPALRSDAMR